MLVEKQKSVDAIGEVDKLKKELSQAHRVCRFSCLLFLNNTHLQEVEALHRSLERQQKLFAKQRKMSNAMITPSKSSYNVEVQDIETSERNYEKQQTTLRNVSTITTAYNEEIPKTSQKSSFTSVCQILCNYYYSYYH